MSTGGYPDYPELDYSFTEFQQSQGNNDFPGTEIDNDHFNLKTSTDEIIDFLKRSFRSDGVLQDEAGGSQGIPGLIGDVSYSATPPDDPEVGDWWMNTNDGSLYWWYTDVDSSQWIGAPTDAIYLYSPVGPPGATVFVLSFPISDRPSDGEEIEGHLFVDAVTFPAGFVGSLAKAGTAATASTVFSITKNGVQVGTVTFALAGTVGTFVLASDLDVAVGDQIDLVCPATRDVTLADIKISLRAEIVA